MGAETSLHTPGTIGDYFSLEGHLMSTRSADSYKAVDKTRGVGVSLWILRHPLQKNSEAVKRFVERLSALHQMIPRVAELSSYGVDNSGMAFAVFPQLDGLPFLAGNLEGAEAERRFISAVKLIDKVHQGNIVCGDLCQSSFWIDRGGDCRFVGVMGSFDAEAAATAMVPPMETMHFIAPEQSSGGGVEPATDVFALGVLGYHVLTKRYPFERNPAARLGQYDLGVVKPISSFVNLPPVWAEEVIFKCLEPHPEKRYANAGEVLAAIQNIRQRVHTQSSSPARTRSESNSPLRPEKPAEAVALKGPSSTAMVKQEKNDASPNQQGGLLRKNSVRMLAGSVFVALVSVAVLQQFKPQSAQEESKLQSELSVHRTVVGNEQLRQAIDVIAEPQVSLQERATELEKIVNSDDPLAHDILVKSAKDAKSPQLRALSEKSIIDRARRLGLVRSAEQIRQWLRTLRAGDMPQSYEAILQSLDTTLPAEAHNSYLRQAYASNPTVVLRLAAGLAIDTGKFEEYQPVIAQLIGDAMRFEDVKSHSTLALILSSPELSVVFGDDVIQRRDKMPDTDILWALKLLAERSDSNVRAIASTAVERGILSQVRGYFLSVVRDRGDLPPDVMASLIRAAAGILRLEDINNFGRWYDVQSEKVLLAVLADSTDPVLLAEAFDNLSGKSLTIEPAVSLVDWVRGRHWDNRANFAHAIGVLSFIDLVSVDDVIRALQGLDAFARDPKLIAILLDTRNTAVVRTVVEKYSEMLGLGGLISLLSYPEKEIRIIAVRKLKDFNDVAALRLIIQNYNNEKEQDVRQIYRETFWVIRERE
jgi:serine/threonine protein kinase